MSKFSQHEILAAERADRARNAHDLGRLDEAIELMREATVLFAAADSAAASDSEERVLSRSTACRLCGDYLAERGDFAEAANIYQEAVDQYSRLDSELAEETGRGCARKILDCIQHLRLQPRERLNLLIAQYEHRQRQFAAQPGHEKQQAECVVHIAQILQRRERYEQAVRRYREAVELFESAGASPDMRLAVAECHHRIGGLLCHRLNDDGLALFHFREAVKLYSEHEPYVYGKQEARSLCERAIREIEGDFGKGSVTDERR